ncbi:MAG: NADH-quinone oxidoreductase subunit D [Fimbriimonadaceae bacterium]|nr:NADH-quinone oxidoreductase subunit D [Fimbriimonadaceae bacterium]
MRQTETLTVNMGPQHPSTHGVLRLIVELDGEVVQAVKPVVGYLHTGMEKELEDQRYIQGITVTDRMDYLSPLSNNLAYVLSIEQLCGLAPPPKGQWLRVLLVELQRISSHLIWLGTHAMDLGATTVFLYCLREREAILDLFEMASGVRLMTTFIRPGGLRQDLPREFYEGYSRDGKRIQGVREFIADFPRRVDDYEALLTTNPIFLRRTQGVGVITADDAVDWCLTGPILRASGVNYDVRRTTPYSSYEQFDFEVPLGTNGDVYDRYLVRVAELRQSARIVTQALAKLATLPDEAPVNADHRDYVPPPKEELSWSMESLIRHFKIWTEGLLPPVGEAYVPVESAKGEIGFYVVSDGTARPLRAHVRPPSFVNLQALEHLAKGHMIADLVACLGSIDIVLGEIDR